MKNLIKKVLDNNKPTRFCLLLRKFVGFESEMRRYINVAIIVTFDIVGIIFDNIKGCHNITVLLFLIGMLYLAALVLCGLFAIIANNFRLLKIKRELKLKTFEEVENILKEYEA